MRRKHQSGFTLIELSIVLVIIGLLVGGVLVGRDLIQAAKLRKVITEVENIKTAVNTFRLKYNCIPGDCANAESYFGTDPAGCGLNVPENTVPTATTCNGNGDGRIGTYNGYNTEMGRSVQQLASASLISASLTGTCTNPSGADCTTNPFTFKVGLSMPPSAISNAGYVLTHQNSVAQGGYGSAPGGGIWHWNAISRDHVIYLTSDLNIHGGQTSYIEGFTGADAYAIDSKMDDGKPGLGNVLTILNFAGTCFTNAAETASTYITNTGVGCALVFNAGF